ncbi:MAG: hypothetical protein JSS41_00280 [Proteobacteria bacterium]|nr:hypothetical protein [Pseudomonadota bacterium]
MKPENEKNFSNAQIKQESDKILGAFEFLDEICSQIGALRKTLKEQIKDRAQAGPLNFTINEFRDNIESLKGRLLYRSQITTFEIYEKPKGNKKKPDIYGAYQISLFPHPDDKLDGFFPYLAVMLAGKAQKHHWEQWDCEEFRLDDGYLKDSNEWDGDPWKQLPNNSWVATDSFAFAVPLVELRNEQDTTSRVIDPLFRKIMEILGGSLPEPA